jgi:hypothetical protein
MSYEIEFDGSLVDNRDLVEVTAASSLTFDTSFQASPALWQFNTQPIGPLPSVQNNTAVSNQTELYTFSGTTTSIANISGVNSAVAPIAGFDVFGGFLQNNGFAGQTAQVQFRTANSAGYNVGNSFFVELRLSGGGFIGNAIANATMASNTTYTYNISIPSNTGYLNIGWFSFGLPVAIEFLTVTAGSATLISTTPSTITNGANKTGGTLITSDIATLQNGSSAISNPSKLFGLRVNDGGSQKLEANFNPSAADNEDSYIDATDVKIITADNTSLDVESFGTGTPDYIERGSSVKVEDVTGYTEN